MNNYVNTSFYNDEHGNFYFINICLNQQSICKDSTFCKINNGKVTPLGYIEDIFYYGSDYFPYVQFDSEIVKNGKKFKSDIKLICNTYTYAYVSISLYSDDIWVNFYSPKFCRSCKDSDWHAFETRF
jgi:hypothetical protein